jgi:hypothetical protein
MRLIAVTHVYLAVYTHMGANLDIIHLLYLLWLNPREVAQKIDHFPSI